jgi:hypothetical protein
MLDCKGVISLGLSNERLFLILGFRKPAFGGSIKNWPGHRSEQKKYRTGPAF